MPQEIPSALRKTIEEKLLILEQLIQTPNELLKLFREKEYDKLSQRLKRLSLEIHPDTVQKKGGTTEEIQRAADNFSEILQPLRDSLSKFRNVC